MKRVDVGPYTFRRRGPVEWELDEARAPHRAFLSESLMEHLAADGDGDGGTARQIANVAALPHADRVVTTPDTHYGYGSPIGTVFVSPATVSLSVVGVDISCGMNLVLTNLTRDQVGDAAVRRELLDALTAEIPMGQGLTRDNGDVVRDFRTLVQRGVEGLRPNIRRTLKLTSDAYEFEQDFRAVDGFWSHIPDRALQRGEATLGSLGGGNHFWEMQSIEVLDPQVAKAWGLRPDQVVLMLHSGSRAFGSHVAGYYEGEAGQLFKVRERAESVVRSFVHEARIRRCRIERRDVGHDEFEVEIDLRRGYATVVYRAPAEHARAYRTGEGRRALSEARAVFEHADGRIRQTLRVGFGASEAETDIFAPRHLEAELPFVLRPLSGSGVPSLGGTAADLATGYWTAVQAAQNFAVLSRTIMQYRAVKVLERMFGAEAADSRLLVDISHNNVQIEPVGGRPQYVHRKGATRAFPPGHPLLAGTAWANTGHPVVVPGSMGSFSYVMRAAPGAEKSAFSVNHGAGRAMSRSAARRELDAGEQHATLDALGTVVRGASLDEMPSAYKDIDEVVRVCVEGGLCEVVARCHPLATAKGDDDPDD